MPTDRYLNKIVLNKMTREQFEQIDKNPDEFYAVTDNTILGGFSMFDTVLKDHVLTYEESKGLALQGTYVYKEAIAGSRYGYPDFYAKCLEEYNQATNTETVNGVTVKVHSNGHKFYDIADKEGIDTFFNSMGSAWMYGIDQENERVFLPRNNWFEQASVDGVGESIEAGLPNIIGAWSGNRVGTTEDTYGFSGALYYKGGAGTNRHASGYDSGFQGINFGFDASRSSSIYGNSDTVQPNAVKKLLYICVGNTVAQSTVTNVIDVTTTENDTIPLGYSTYQNGAQPSVSWLKSEGQWNDGNVYTTFYNEFVQKIGQAFASGYVREITEEYTDYDLVINQDDMTFRLPLLDGSEDLPSDRYDELTLGASGDTYIAPANGWFNVRLIGGSNQYVEFVSSLGSQFGCGSGLSAIGNIYVKRGEVVKINYSATGSTTKRLIFTYAQGNGSLYFKVANAVQNLELLDAGEVLDAVANVVPNNSELITSFGCPDYENAISLPLTQGTTMSYSVPSNGFIVADFTAYNASLKSYLKINGVVMFNGSNNNVSNYMNSKTGQYLVSKGDIIQYLANYRATQSPFSEESIKFIPMKGAN